MTGVFKKQFFGTASRSYSIQVSATYSPAVETHTAVFAFICHSCQQKQDCLLPFDLHHEHHAIGIVISPLQQYKKLDLGAKSK